ncbi:MAG: nicotinate (nicotinamide) nucleotide adenylyltransferase [Planctomycetaceae bacterium]|nr:nicotinate (nicotinamide) nucleotide adenylyltransferase [Planctomycetaceae bacterium]
MVRIGIFGGTFDPVHNGHLMLADAALAELQLDRLFLVPVAQSPFKPEDRPTGNGARVDLLRLAFDGRTGCAIDEQELRRGGASYTIDTVRDFHARHPEDALTCLIGADHVPTLPEWRDAEALARLARFAAVPRPGETPVEFPAPFRGIWLRGTPVEVSGSDIRARIRAGRDFQHLVPSAVAAAIKNLNLYAE